MTLREEAEMSDDEIRELRKLCDAVPGEPWGATGWQRVFFANGREEECSVVTLPHGYGPWDRIWIKRDKEEITPETATRHRQVEAPIANFIATARTAVPKLLDELEAAQSRVARLRALLAKFTAAKLPSEGQDQFKGVRILVCPDELFDEAKAEVDGE